MMADLLPARGLTDEPRRCEVAETTEVVISDRVLLGLQDGAAEVEGYARFPATWRVARHRRRPGRASVAYATHTGGLVAMTEGDLLPPALAGSSVFVTDCRTPGATPGPSTGTTSSRSTRAASDRWHARVSRAVQPRQAGGRMAGSTKTRARHTVETTTPTGPRTPHRTTRQGSDRRSGGPRRPGWTSRPWELALAC